LNILPLLAQFCAKARQIRKGFHMKQKYTLNIAGLQISVVTDASPDEVERIRGLLDRKIREITLKSRCPKTEAALLCAMEFAADRITLQDQVTAAEDRCDRYDLENAGLRGKAAELNAEIEKLKNENAVLRSLVTAGGGAVSPNPISPTAFFAEVADAQSAPVAPAAPAPADDGEDEAPVPVAEKRSRRPGSRVGLMFEQLSFDDAD
jgi:hypothetical protein